MTKKTEKEKKDVPSPFAHLAGEDYCYLTTAGRVSGKPHEIEIWFGLHERTLYLLSGGGEGSDWVKNLHKQPEVTVRLGKGTFKGRARFVAAGPEELLARRLLAAKYQEWHEGKRMTEWARSALPVAIDLEAE